MCLTRPGVPAGIVLDCYQMFKISILEYTFDEVFILTRTGQSVMLKQDCAKFKQACWLPEILDFKCSGGTFTSLYKGSGSSDQKFKVVKCPAIIICQSLGFGALDWASDFKWPR